MPIVQINMLPKHIEDTYEELSKKIEAAILDCKINGILPGEVMVDIHMISNENTNKNNFVYVKIWMYKRDDRVEKTFKIIQSVVGQVVFMHLKKHWKEFNMLEVLPVNVLNQDNCIIYGR